MKRVAIVLALMLTVLVGTVEAYVGGHFYVVWNTPYQTIYYTIDQGSGPTAKSALIAEAHGWFKEYNTESYVSYGRVFCVDLYKTAAGGMNNAYEVAKLTGADGNYGWITPQGNTDRWRDRGDLQRTAYLANTFGGSYIENSADKRDRHIGLNVAMWQAAYGNRFALNTSYTYGGMTLAQYSYYQSFLGYYNQGYTHNYYTWFDSKFDDDYSTNQDFMRGGEIPEPSTLILLGLGLTAAGIGVVRRRRKS